MGVGVGVGDNICVLLRCRYAGSAWLGAWAWLRWVLLWRLCVVLFWRLGSRPVGGRGSGGVSEPYVYVEDTVYVIDEHVWFVRFEYAEQILRAKAVAHELTVS